MFLKKLILITPLFALFACSESNQKPLAPLMPDSLADNQIIMDISKQIDTEPGNAELYYQRSQVYFNLKYLGMAEEDLKYAIILDSINPLYWYNLGRTHYAMNQTKNAEQDYLNAIRFKQDYTEAMIKLADLYFLVKEHSKSVQYIKNAIALKPDDAFLYHMLGMNFKETGDTARAIFHFQTAVEKDPTDYDSYLYIANLLAAQKKDIAFQYYNAAIKLRPNNTEAIFARGVLAQNLKLYTQAILDYNRVVKRDPMHYLSYYNTGYIYFETDKFDKALNAFNVCTRLNGNYLEAYYMKGLIYEMQKNKADAKLNYTYCLELNPEYSLAKEGLQRLQK